MIFEALWAGRTLLSRRSRKLLHIVSLITFIGVAFGVAALLLTLAVLEGFEKTYRQSVLAFNAHVMVMGVEDISEPKRLAEDIRRVAGDHTIKGLIPFRYREALAIQGNEVRGLAIKALEMENYWELSGLRHQVLLDEASEGLWIGQALWDDLDQSGERLKVRLPGPDAESADFFDLPVAGTFTSGMYEYDATFALLDLKTARRLLGWGPEIGGLEIWLHDPAGAESLALKLAESVAIPYTVLTWQDLNAGLFEALKLEKLIFVLITGLLILVASFNIMGTLSMRVLERRRDIAILRALGARWRQIRFSFFLQGVMLSWLGAALGVAAAWALIFVLGDLIPIRLEASVYFIDHVPIEWQPVHGPIVFGITGLFAWCSAQVALLRLKKLSVINALGEAGG